MTKQEILTHIDHTQLKAFCTWEDIKKLCDEAIKYNTASVCIPPSYIERIKETYGDKINICTVIGFPLGYNTTETKVFEVKDAYSAFLFSGRTHRGGGFIGYEKENRYYNVMHYELFCIGILWKERK